MDARPSVVRFFVNAVHLIRFPIWQFIVEEVQYSVVEFEVFLDEGFSRELQAANPF